LTSCPRDTKKAARNAANPVASILTRVASATMQRDDRLSAGRLRRLRYRLWWAWAKFRLGSDVLLAAGYEPPDARR
jgi:hypothetical protein